MTHRENLIAFHNKRLRTPIMARKDTHRIRLASLARCFVEFLIDFLSRNTSPW